MPILLIITIIIIIIIISLSTPQTTRSLLLTIFKEHRFANISIIYSNYNFEIIRADKAGENYLFGVRKDYSGFTPTNIHSLYEYAQKNHIHKIIIATYTEVGKESSVYRLIKSYGIEVWDLNKLINLSKSFDATQDTSYKASVLSTSDTSDDTCPQNSSFNPIQEGNPKTNNIFSGLFQKPDRL